MVLNWNISCNYFYQTGVCNIYVGMTHDYDCVVGFSYYTKGNNPFMHVFLEYFKGTTIQLEMIT